jgi:hypothetical protein
MFDVTPDPPRYENHADDSNDEIEAVKPRLQTIVFVPLFAELLAHVRQCQTPRE